VCVCVCVCVCVWWVDICCEFSFGLVKLKEKYFYCEELGCES
jgi:hypothetical protein